MTEDNLSQKLFTQKDGKQFAYADEIRKAIKKLKDKMFNPLSKEMWEYLCGEIDKSFGEELSK